MGYGGPHAAFLATRDEYKRQMPGPDHRRLEGRAGQPGLSAWRCRPASSTSGARRRPSNICTAQVLLAIIAGMYAVYHGPDGLRAIARRVHALTAALADGAAPRRPSAGRRAVLRHPARSSSAPAARRPTACSPAAARARHQPAQARRRARVGISLDETVGARRRRRPARSSSARDPQALAALAAVADALGDSGAARAHLGRSSTHPVFHRYHTEHEMLRYIQRLEARDLSLAHSMIPLGSCTMKLNATTEMLPVTWPELADLHPFAPAEQAEGYAQILSDLERWLCEITGFAAVSLQPNAGIAGRVRRPAGHPRLPRDARRGGTATSA